MSKQIIVGAATAIIIGIVGFAGNWLTNGGLIHLLGGVTKAELETAVEQARNRIHDSSDQSLSYLDTDSVVECFDRLEDEVGKLDMEYHANRPTFVFLYSEQFFIGFACNSIRGRVTLNAYYTANSLHRGAPREIIETVVEAIAP